jgi:GNAT superfamily N-acetyltransferase
VEVHEVGPGDDEVFVRCYAVWHLVEHELWPDRAGFSERDFRAFHTHVGTSRRFALLAARKEDGTVLGTGTMEFPLRDNLHSAEVMVMVHPDHRRQHVGSALVERMGALARADGRRVLNSLVDVPVASAPTHPSADFARRVGFVATLSGNSRYLALPLDAGRLDELRATVRGGRNAADYRTFAFRTPWPEAYLEDQCELYRRMSTDEPAGDGDKEEEVWDRARVAENDELVAARGACKLAAVAEHVPSGRLVAVTELLVDPGAPAEAWQLETLVLPAHRGSRLGLAVKLANLDALADAAPSVRRITTGNAAVNDPMIAVNEMMGFSVAGTGHFWQRDLSRSA